MFNSPEDKFKLFIQDNVNFIKLLGEVGVIMYSDGSSRQTYEVNYSFRISAIFIPELITWLPNFMDRMHGL